MMKAFLEKVNLRKMMLSVERAQQAKKFTYHSLLFNIVIIHHCCKCVIHCLNSPLPPYCDWQKKIIFFWPPGFPFVCLCISFLAYQSPFFACAKKGIKKAQPISMQ
jgi:hypothetical protein